MQDWRGVMLRPAMRQFSAPHLAALAVMAIGVVVPVAAARHGAADEAWTRWFAWALAGGILCAWAGEYIDDIALGIWSVRFTLPAQLTDVISLTAVVALVTRRLWAVELVYYWAFTATLQAVLTPDLAHTFPAVLYFTYFGYHAGAIVAAAFLVYGLRLYPRPGAVWRVFGVTVAWAVVAGVVDVATGGNYMYLAWKPVHSSLLSVLGPWPWYIAASVVVGLALLWVVAGLTRVLRVAFD
jgi:hypothetical integral membrane protein (TIGR02206 family)